jgi:signal transduction histidine kinase/CheY-like chemotaxis protein
LVRAASAEEMRADIDRDLWQKATIAVGLSVLFAAMISFFGNLQIVKPLLLLKKRVKEGDAKIDRNITFSREVSELAEAFEKSFQEIKEQKKKLDLGKEELERQVKERTSQLEISNSELTKSKLELQQNQRLREIFIGQINHDIRNPLQIIGGCVRRLRRARAPEQYVAELEQAGGRIHRLVDDLRDYQVIVNGAADPRLREFDPRDLFDEVQREFAAKAEANRVLLNFTVEDDVPTMLSDRDWLLRIVANLVSNACKFTRDGTIDCRMWLDTDDGCRSVCIEVADSGRGMSPEEQAKLFVPYEKIASVDENPDGTGLGLVICKEYCKRLQGGIRVVPERTALGRGTTFLVRVAARLAPTAPTVQRQSLTPAAGNRIDRERPLALVVDDEAEICRLIGEHLSQLGFDVITAHDGLKALELARERLPDLVTLDIQIPLLDGWHVLRDLKAAAATKSIPVVLVTVQDNLTKGFTLGAADFLGKPIDFDHFEAVVSRFRPTPNEGSILVVDDELELRQSLAVELANRGWRVVDAADGIEAFERLRAGFRPDVVLLDLLMPRMNGFEFAREVRNDPAFRDIPIIVLTGQQLTPADRDRFGGCVQRIIEKQSLAWSELLDQISTAAKRIQSKRSS